MTSLRKRLLAALAWLLILSLGDAVSGQELRLPTRWQYSPPWISPEVRDEEPSRAQKDPTVVFHEGKWHVFMTVKLGHRTAMEYCSFSRWEEANQSKRTLLQVSDSQYFCAPQVFFFEPHRRWYLVYQVGMPGLKKMWVAYSTTTTPDDPSSWTRAAPILDGGQDDPRSEGGLDYWIICDAERAYLFFTSLNGKLWRTSTELKNFPHGFGPCEVALRGEFFEASHTYKLKGRDQYLTIIEQDGQRYMKAYLADRLDGPWRPWSEKDAHFISHRNIAPAPGVQAWTDNVSHGEFIRASNDQTLTIDPADLQFVFQGLLESEKRGKPYGDFPWRIGILRPEKQP